MDTDTNVCHTVGFGRSLIKIGKESSLISMTHTNVNQSETYLSLETKDKQLLIMQEGVGCSRVVECFLRRHEADLHCERL